MKHFAGLDVSVKETSICIVNDTGRIVPRKVGPYSIASSVQARSVGGTVRPRALPVEVDGKIVVRAARISTAASVVGS